MKRTSLFLPEPMLDALADLSKTTGTPVAELVRAAITAYLKRASK